MKRNNVVISKFDKEAYKMIRNNISKFLRESAKKYDKKGILVLDIAPQVHEGAKSYFKKAKVETLDIDPNSDTTYIADITKYNEFLPDEKFDIIVCTEVLEHTLDPFSAIKEIYRLLKPRGVLLLIVPFNFRVHGPLPDCWRFTEHGLRELLKRFSTVKIDQIDTPGRDLMPIHYTVIAIKGVK
ncbi:MAG TPA: class I SAM-dependent methyltransferase [Thermoplasmata archaeon]|nr:class I SAM-dependent methyltransferase [Thermoplasmata archaeon]